jgi:predicted transcriptional regulator
MIENDGSQDNLLTLTADIVAAHVSNNSVAVNDLPSLITKVHQALSSIPARKAEPPERVSPAVSPRSSVRADSVTCLECGQKKKVLKRHLSTAHDMTPTQYRRKYSLAPSHPIVAPSYAEHRRTLAKSIHLGRKGSSRARKK